MGHYVQYVASLNFPGNNIGTFGEAQLAGPDITEFLFGNGVRTLLTDSRTRIYEDTSFEACNRDFTLTPVSCLFRGNINYAQAPCR